VELLALQNQRFFWMMKELTPELLKGCRNDDRRSQSLLYEMISGVLYGMTRRYYINKEDRIMQVNTAYMKILTSLKKQTPEGSFEAWCRSIMRNCIIDEFRKNKRHREIMDSNELSDQGLDPQTFQAAHENVDADELENMLLRLPEATRCVFNLFAIEGYSHQEISAQTGMSEGTSRWHVSDARSKLRSWITEAIQQKSNTK
jgi:RNA polymerase sigma factor (sigma-70 family)